MIEDKKDRSLSGKIQRAIFLFILTLSIFLGSFTCKHSAVLVQATEGIALLPQDWNSPIDITGQWQNYPETFRPNHNEAPEWVITRAPKRGGDPMGYGTSRMLLMLPQGDVPPLSIRFAPTSLAMDVLVNGQFVTGTGILSGQADRSLPGAELGLIHLPDLNSRELLLEIRYSNYHHVDGSIPLVTIGSRDLMTFQDLLRQFKDLLFTGCFLAVGILYLVQFMQRTEERASLWFGLICLGQSLRMLLVGSAILDRYLPHEWAVTLHRLEYINLIALVFCFYLFAINVFRQKKPQSKWIRLCIGLLSMGYALICLLAPMRVYTYLLYYYDILILIIGILSITPIFLAWRDNQPFAGTVMGTMIIILMAGIWDILFYNYIVTRGPLLGYAMFAGIMIQGILLISRFTQNMYRLEELSQNYRSTNMKLFSSKQKIEEQNKRLNQLAFIDQLTQLPNRISLLDILGDKVDQARRNSTLLGVFYVDMDNFKLLNDTLGQEMGDSILYHFAQRLKDRIRRSDSLFRVTSDEFVIVVENVKEVHQIGLVADKIFAAFEDPLQIENRDVHITISMGIAHWDNSMTQDNFNSLVRKADVALSKAKERGKNCYAYYSQEMDEELNIKLKIEERLRVALQEDHFQLYYQAQIDIATGKLHGYEALIRWIDPQEGMISPGQFIPLAEQIGLIVDIGKWVLTESCRQIRSWLDQGHRDFTISANLSVKQFEREEIIPFLSSLIEDFSIPPEYLVIELTESSLMMDSRKVTEKMLRIKELGLKIAIDDFGTGYSNLGYLSAFPLDILKIDRLFVQNLRQNEKDRKLVSAIINIARSLELKIVAEGVEDQDVMEILSQQGCDYIQGFLYSRPVPAQEAVSFFQFTVEAKP